MGSYRVVSRRVAGSEPGDVIEIDDAELASYLVDTGHVVSVAGGQTETNGLPDGGLVESE